MRIELERDDVLQLIDAGEVSKGGVTGAAEGPIRLVIG